VDDDDLLGGDSRRSRSRSRSNEHVANRSHTTAASPTTAGTWQRIG